MGYAGEGVTHLAWPLSGWWRRAAAQIIDFLLIVVVALVVGGAVATKNTEAGFGLGFTIYLFGGVPYYTLAHGSRPGKTVGKLVFGIAVKTDPERAGEQARAGYGRAFGRALMFMFFAFVPLLGLLNVLWPLWDYKRQAWHDKIAGTVVVKTRGQNLVKTD